MTTIEMLRLKDEYPDAFRVLEDRLHESNKRDLVDALISNIVNMAVDDDIVVDYRLVEMSIIIQPEGVLAERLKLIQDEINESRAEEIANGTDKE